MPDNDLKTRITLDSEEASREMDGIKAKAEALRLQEFASQQQMIRELSTLGVDEYDKQIKAQERLLEQLRLKQEAASDKERERIVREYAERKQGFEERLHGLDEENAALQGKHAERLQELEELKRAETVNKDAVLEKEKEIAKLIEESRQNYLDKTETAYEMEKDRLDTLRDIAGRVREGAEAEGEGGDGGGFRGMAAAVKGLPDQLNRAGGRLQRALAPMLRILGPVGIAFSLEQVVEKLYKANEELRVIRNNYAQIAATMGDLVGIGGGLYAGRMTGEMMALQHRIERVYADAFDQKVIPTIAQALGRGGFQPEEMPALTEDVLWQFQRAGVSPQALGQMYADLYKRFEIPAGELESVIHHLIEAAQELRIPFEDLHKWTMTLAEQTRLYGYTVEDSERLVVEFAHELEEGTLQLSDLVRAQRSLADINEQQGMALLLFMDRVEGFLEGIDLGMPFQELLGMIEGVIGREQFLEMIAQGRLPQVVREQIPGTRLEEPLGRIFTPEGELTPVGQDLRLALERMQIAIIESLAEEFARGDVFMQPYFEQLLAPRFLPGVAGMPFAQWDAFKEAVKEGGLETGQKIIDALGKGDAITIEEARKQSQALAEQRRTESGRIASGIRIWFREASDEIFNIFRRAVGDDMKDVAVHLQSLRGRGLLGDIERIAGPGFNIETPGQWSVEQILQLGPMVMERYEGDIGRARAFMMDFIQMLTLMNALPGVSYEQAPRLAGEAVSPAVPISEEMLLGAAEKVFFGPSWLFRGAGEERQRTRRERMEVGLPSPEERAELFRREQAETLAEDITRHPRLYQDIEPGTPGLQIIWGDLNISFSGFQDPDEVARLVKEDIDRVVDDVILPAYRDALREFEVSTK